MSLACNKDTPHYCDPTDPTNLIRNDAKNSKKLVYGQCVSVQSDCKLQKGYVNKTGKCKEGNKGGEKCNQDAESNLESIPVTKQEVDEVVRGRRVRIQEEKEEKNRERDERVNVREQKRLINLPRPIIPPIIVPAPAAPVAPGAAVPVARAVALGSAAVAAAAAPAVDDDFLNWYQGINFPGLNRMFYSDEYRYLLELISIYMKRIVRTDKCKANHDIPLEENPTLEDLLCHFSYVYSPQPGNDRGKNALINNRIGEDSVFGRIFNSKVSGQDIVTKVPVMIAEDTTIEIFMNIVVINTILIHPFLSQLSNHLAPSFGIFVCGTNVPVDGSPLDNSIPLQSCMPGLNGIPSLFLIQKQVKNQDDSNASTLSGLIKKRKVTWADVSEYISQAFSVLTLLEQSPLRIAHNDLHTGNLLITNHTKGRPGKAVLIDWGKASFTINGKYYGQDTKRFEPYGTLCTAAIDLLQLARVGKFDTADALRSAPPITADEEKDINEINSNLSIIINLLEDRLEFLHKEYSPAKDAAGEYPYTNEFITDIIRKQFRTKNESERRALIKRYNQFTYYEAVTMLNPFGIKLKSFYYECIGYMQAISFDPAQLVQNNALTYPNLRTRWNAFYKNLPKMTGAAAAAAAATGGYLSGLDPEYIAAAAAAGGAAGYGLGRYYFPDEGRRNRLRRSRRKSRKGKISQGKKTLVKNASKNDSKK
jgi:hypothetical protein